MRNIISIMALMVTIVKCGRLDHRLGAEFATQIHNDTLYRLAIIDQIENILIKLLSKDEPRLTASRQILSKQKADIKEISLEALNAVDTYILKLKSILIDSKNKIRKQQRKRRNAKQISQLGLNYTIEVMETIHRNIEALFSSLSSLENELENELMDDEKALSEANEIVENMKDMLMNYHSKVLETTHKAKLDLDEIIHFLNKNYQSDNPSSDVEKEQASYIKYLLGIFEQQKKEEDEAVRDELKKLKPQVEELKLQIEELRKQLKRRDEQIINKDERIDKLLEKNDQLHTISTSLKDELHKIEIELIISQTNTTQANYVIQNLIEREKQNNQMKDHQLAQKQQEIERLDREVQQLKQENQLKASELSQKAVDHVSLRNELNQINQQNSIQKMQLAEATKSLENLKMQIIQKDQSIQQTQTQLRQKDQAIDSLKKQCDSKDREMNRLNADISRLSQTTTPRSSTKQSMNKLHIVYPDDPEDSDSEDDHFISIAGRSRDR